MEAVRMLAREIGPRPPCSDAEAAAARYCAGRLEQHGLEVDLEEFDSRPSAAPWIGPYLGLAAAAALLLPWFPLGALVGGAAALVLYARDVDGRPLVAPRHGTSVNVIARRSAAETPSLVVVAELDSDRASLPFSPRFLPGPRAWALLIHGCLLVLPLAGGGAWVAESTRPLPPRLWILAVVLAGAFIAAIAVELYSQRNLPLIEGANDNASGVEVVIRLTRRFPDTDVWWVLVGSGNSGQLGMQAFIERHGHDLGDARILCVRGTGAGVLSAASDEGFLRSRRADPALLDAAVEAGAGTTAFRVVQSAAAVAMAHRRPALSIVGVDDRGAIPNQRWTDTLASVDEKAVEHATNLVARVVEVSTGHIDTSRSRPPTVDGSGSG